MSSSEASDEERLRRFLEEIGIKGEPSDEIRLQARIQMREEARLEQERAEEMKKLRAAEPKAKAKKRPSPASDPAAAEAARSRYLRQLEIARRPRVDVDRWVRDWKRAETEAQKHGVAEVRSRQARVDLLQAIRARMDPAWARHELHELAKMREAEGLPSLVSIVGDFVRWREMERAGGR